MSCRKISGSSSSSSLLQWANYHSLTHTRLLVACAHVCTQTACGKATEASMYAVNAYGLLLCLIRLE
jgi:hypothetical protein